VQVRARKYRDSYARNVVDEQYELLHFINTQYNRIATYAYFRRRCKGKYQREREKPKVHDRSYLSEVNAKSNDLAKCKNLVLRLHENVRKLELNIGV
jgi:hypothetical protein